MAIILVKNLTFTIRCKGLHRLTFRDGTLVPLDHPAEEAIAEVALHILGKRENEHTLDGTKISCRCVEVMLLFQGYNIIRKVPDWELDPKTYQYKKDKKGKRIKSKTATRNAWARLPKQLKSIRAIRWWAKRAEQELNANVEVNIVAPRSH